MFRGEQLTADDHQRRQVRQLHALTIWQTAATTGENCRGMRAAAGNAPPSPKMQENLQEKTFACALHTIIPTETSGTAALSCKIGVKMQEDSASDTTTTTGDDHRPGIRGGGLQFGGAKGKRRAVQLSSPYPCSFSRFLYGNKHTERRCGKLEVRGVVLKPMQKKETAKRSRSKN